MKLGSLFDGSGGFPLAGAMCGIEPVWAAEVEPYPIAVTRSRFPNMEHLGDISKVNGAEVEPVDIITFGSPCQDLSVAGLRKGLKHEANGDEETTRSGLFMEAVRIIKEMRKATNGEFPKVCLWENVPGAFSSNKGEDFRIVCEELIKIVEPRAFMPEVPKNGWPYADSYIGDGWSLAYRVFDAQYWGVPQRRRRIHLVVDFRGTSAREILFEREGLRGYFAEGRTPWKAITPGTQGGSGADDSQGESGGDGRGRQLDAVAYTLKVRSVCAVDSGGKVAGKVALIQEDKAATLATVQDQYLFQPVLDSLPFDTTQVTSPMNYSSPKWGDPCHPLAAGAHPPAVLCKCWDARGNGDGEKVGTITGDHESRITDYTSVVCCIDGDKIGKAERSGGSGLGIRAGDRMYTLTAKDAGTHAVVYESHPMDSRVRECDGVSPTVAAKYAKGTADTPLVCAPIPIQDQATRFSGKRGDKQDGKGNGLGIGSPGEPMFTITGADRHATAYGVGNGQVNQTIMENRVGALNCMHDQQAVIYKYIVRRLTPTECSRLQGFADWWGILEAVDGLSQKDYQFWLNVRNTHAAINGKAVKDYSPAQMVAWYNKLQTDSAEYKMWGNGIALPPALYCMQGIVEALSRAAEDDSWML